MFRQANDKIGVVVMRPQRKHHRNDNGDCDSSSANDVDIDDYMEDGGQQQRKQMREQIR